ncbi:hypothetical protein [Sediminimonas sp.]|uniref:hypothetical protein n=1 Tax=Sediminimonas sp. TaxID=2823379 RepID=UPI0025D85DEA|nr:hypothetical protein [Sediminimonas sp.]
MANERACYGIVLEAATEGPILMEAEGQTTSREQAVRRLRQMIDGRRWFRGCVVRLIYEEGNRATLDAMAGMQSGPQDRDDREEGFGSL